jgi:predicted polyphosphate/ATP-dependent NAD kinase
LQFATVGFLINPIAGMGGAVGLKGTDGPTTLREAIKKGAKPVAPTRAKEFLTNLFSHNAKLRLVTAPGVMGATIAHSAGIAHDVVGSLKGKTSARDTARISRLMKRRKVDLLVFCGGDGTARDIFKAIDNSLPVLGVPSGVKVYSSVFAINPRAAAETTLQFLNQTISTKPGEVLDIDEKEYRQNRLQVKLLGTLPTPDAGPLVQNPKEPSRSSEALEMEEIADDFKEQAKSDLIYVLGPGTTTEKIAARLGVKKTLLGVEVVKGDGTILGRDVDESTLLRLVKPSKTRIVVSPIGGTGFLLGRGNQQISSRVLSQVGPGNIIIVAARTKVEALNPRRLLVDTGDEKLDQVLRGYRRVLTGYREEMVVKVE